VGGGGNGPGEARNELPHRHPGGVRAALPGSMACRTPGRTLANSCSCRDLCCLRHSGPSAESLRRDCGRTHYRRLSGRSGGNYRCGGQGKPGREARSCFRCTAYRLTPGAFAFRGSGHRPRASSDCSNNPPACCVDGSTRGVGARQPRRRVRAAGNGCRRFTFRIRGLAGPARRRIRSVHLSVDHRGQSRAWRHSTAPRNPSRRGARRTHWLWDSAVGTAARNRDMGPGPDAHHRPGTGNGECCPHVRRPQSWLGTNNRAAGRRFSHPDRERKRRRLEVSRAAVSYGPTDDGPD
jgi:hypothetical protein